MKVAVTGATGFVGRHLLDELALMRVEVVATRRSSSAPADSARPVQWVEMDIADAAPDAFEQLGRPDALIHLAWDGLPNYRSLHHVEDELPRHYRFLASLVRQGLGVIVATGTCFEYGMQSGALAASAPTHPANPYGFAKDTLRRQLQLLQAVHPFALTWARMFYMHGEGQPATSLLPLLRKAVAAGEREFRMSGGEQLRDYMPVTEVARELVRCALAPQDRGPINVCSGIPISVRRLVEGWISEHGWDITLRLGELPYPDYEPMAFWGLRADVLQ